jgi:hypothetical protein
MMKKFIVISNNKIKAIYVCQDGTKILCEKHESIVDVTEEKRKLKKGDKYKSLWGRLWDL